MTNEEIRFSERPDMQSDLAERHDRIGRDSTGCYLRTCSICGRIFYAARPHAMLCSQRCNQVATLRRRHERNRRMRHRRCPRCGALFVARRKDGVYCSNACRQAMHRRRVTHGVTGKDSK